MRDITKLLDAFGIPNNIKGYQYLVSSEKLVAKNPLVVHSLKNELYPAIAKDFNTTTLGVEHAIKNAIKVGWESGKMRSVLNAMLKKPIFGPHDKMSSGEIIALIADANFDFIDSIPNAEPKKVEIVNDFERPVGRIITVIKAHKSGAWHKAVGLYIVNDKNQVLLQKRSRFKSTYPGLWDATCGGHIRAGETALDCAIREAHDHLGLQLSHDDVEFIGSAKTVDVNSHKWDRHFNKHFVAFKNVDLKKLHLLEHEVDDAKWVDFDDFKESISKRDKQIAARWHAHNAFVKYIEHKHIMNHDNLQPRSSA